MAIGFVVGDECYSVGSGDFLYSFFSTIAYNLENGDWGIKYPYIMNELYGGELEVESAKECLAELEIIRNELKKYLPDKVVWDIDDLSKRPGLEKALKEKGIRKTELSCRKAMFLFEEA